VGVESDAQMTTLTHTVGLHAAMFGQEDA
jgi:hypothetical protein